MKAQKASDVATVDYEGQWRSRIVGHGEESPDQLLANPRNWRIHPRQQQDALAEALDRVGWVQSVIVNQTTGHVVDGHLRVMLAMRREEPKIPVAYVELSAEEEALVLATLDPLAGLAATDGGALKGLLADLESELGGELAHMMADLTKTVGDAASRLPSQDEIEKVADELLDRYSGDGAPWMIDVTCPHCSEEFAINGDELQKPS